MHAVWLQPGTYDEEGLAYARREFPGAAVGGLEEAGGWGGDGEGWCVLIDGDEFLARARRSDKTGNGKGESL